jgi:hypothetical protein
MANRPGDKEWVMAMPRKIKIDCKETYLYGLFAVSDVSALRNFDKSTAEMPVQAVDEETGERVWTVEVMDADPEARKSERHFTVKLLAPVQPVMPARPAGFPPNVPFIPVEFTGMTATPWVEELGEGRRSRLAWSFRATGMVAPKYGSKPVPVPDEKAS